MSQFYLLLFHLIFILILITIPNKILKIITINLNTLNIYNPKFLLLKVKLCSIGFSDIFQNINVVESNLKYLANTVWINEYAN
jgi:hypothetical protein